MQTKVYNMSGEVVGEIELSEVVFGIAPNAAVVHDSVKNHLANKRQGTQSALTRAEVSGGGRKPWRQKGTGRARQGSTRAPQWTHGGIVFAPKPRDYSYTLNKKAKRLALKSVLISFRGNNQGLGAAADGSQELGEVAGLGSVHLDGVDDNQVGLSHLGGQNALQSQTLPRLLSLPSSWLLSAATPRPWLLPLRLIRMLSSPAATSPAAKSPSPIC